jgi:hypothetical protein
MKVKNFDFQKIKVTNDEVEDNKYNDDENLEENNVEEEERVSNQMIERNKMKKAIQKLKNKNIIKCDYNSEMDDAYKDVDEIHYTDLYDEIYEEQEYFEEDPCDELYEEINNIDNYNRVYIKDLL